MSLFVYNVADFDIKDLYEKQTQVFEVYLANKYRNEVCVYML